MNSRTYKTDKQSLLNEGKRIVSSNDDAKYLRKVTLVNLMLNGATASSLSPSCGETSRTLSSWIKTVDEHGFEALRPKKQSGRPQKLSLEQKEEIKDVLLSDPSDYGYNVWDGPALSDFIENKYSVSISVRQCQRLFHKLGFSQIRPQAFPSKEHEDVPERNEFKKTQIVSRRSKCHSCFSR